MTYLTEAEAARVLGISPSTLRSDDRFALHAHPLASDDVDDPQYDSDSIERLAKDLGLIPDFSWLSTAVDVERFETAAEAAMHPITDPDVRVAFGRLFALAQHEVDDHGIDLVILAERRLACVYRLLVSRGMPPLKRCEVVSDRLLDTEPPTRWRNKRTLVLDDTVIVGSTLERLHRKLDGSKDILVRAVCRSVDAATRSAFLFSEMDFRAMLDDAEPERIAHISEEIVLSLALGLVPYLSDFPITRRLSFAPADWQDFLKSTPWHVVDVTPPLFQKMDAELQTLSLIAPPAVADNILTRVVPEAARFTDLFKVRLFTRVTEDRVSVVIVPIALVGPASVKNLTRAITAIADDIHTRFDERPAIDWRAWPAQPKHRLLQLYLSSVALADLWPTLPSELINGGFPELNNTHLDLLHAELYASTHYGKMTAAFDQAVRAYAKTLPGTYPTSAPISFDIPRPSPLLENEDLARLILEEQEFLAALDVPQRPDPGTLAKMSVAYSHALASIFGFVDREIEDPQRENIFSFGHRFRTEEEALAAYREEYQTEQDRTLNRSLRLHELLQLAGTELDHDWAVAVLSLGLDVANDLGIVVPRSHFDDVRDIAYRCYRLGENADIAERPLTELLPYRTDALQGEYDRFMRDARDQGLSLVWKPPSTDEVARNANGDVNGRLAAALDSSIQRALANALPGRIVARYSGVVIDIDPDDGEFSAELISHDDSDTIVATLHTDLVPVAQQERIKAGTRIIWTIFDSGSDSHRDRTSRIRVPRPEPLDVHRIRRAARNLPSFDLQA